MLVVAAAMLVIVAGTYLATSTSAAGSCAGYAVTQSGSGTITGTPARDVIQGSNGADTIKGLGGDDVICGNGGDDTIYGGPGVDELYGGSGNDTIYGGNDEDVIYGQRGSDTLDGGSGWDVIYADTTTNSDNNDKCFNGEQGYFCDRELRGNGLATPDHKPVALPCDLFASFARGDDANPGTASRPIRTVEHLINSLKPGETGCLAPGETFREADQQVDVRNHGSPAGPGVPQKPITLRTEPVLGQKRAVVLGRIHFCKNSTGIPRCALEPDPNNPGNKVPSDAHDIVFRDLILDGTNNVAFLQGSTSRAPSPTVNADRITFFHDYITTHHTVTCIHLGSAGFGEPDGTVIDSNRVADCGPLPKAGQPVDVNNTGMGITVELSKNATIKKNYIYSNADLGVLVEPGADTTLIDHNVIDRNGRAIYFECAPCASGPLNTTVTRNVMSNSVLHYKPDIGTQYQVGGDATPDSATNVVHDNCLFEANGNNLGGAGYTAYSNIQATSGAGYDPPPGNYHRTGSPPAFCGPGFGPPVNSSMEARDDGNTPGGVNKPMGIDVLATPTPTEAIVEPVTSPGIPLVRAAGGRTGKALPLTLRATVPTQSTVYPQGTDTRVGALTASGRRRFGIFTGSPYKIVRDDPARTELALLPPSPSSAGSSPITPTEAASGRAKCMKRGTDQCCPKFPWLRKCKRICNRLGSKCDRVVAQKCDSFLAVLAGYFTFLATGGKSDFTVGESSAGAGATVDQGQVQVFDNRFPGQPPVATVGPGGAFPG